MAPLTLRPTTSLSLPSASSPPSAHHGRPSSYMGITFSRTESRPIRMVAYPSPSIKFLWGGGTACSTLPSPPQWMRQASPTFLPHWINLPMPVGLPITSGTHHQNCALSSIASPWLDGTQCRMPGLQGDARAQGLWPSDPNCFLP